MTWYERGLSTQQVSLAHLFAGGTVDSSTDHADFDQILNNICTTGFPAHIHRSAEDSHVIMNAYAREITRTDLHRISDIRHQPAILEKFLSHEHLVRTAALLDADHPPSFLAIVSGTGMTLQLNEQCVTFPLNALCP